MCGFVCKCGVFNVWVCVCVGIVMRRCVRVCVCVFVFVGFLICGCVMCWCFGNKHTCIYSVLYCFVYVYLFILCYSLIIEFTYS